MSDRYDSVSSVAMQEAYVTPEVHRHTPTGAVIRFLFTVFGYVWWAVIVVYFGFFDEYSTGEIQLVSFPLTVAGLALACCFHLALLACRYGFATLFVLGLLVCGALA